MIKTNKTFVSRLIYLPLVLFAMLILWYGCSGVNANFNNRDTTDSSPEWNGTSASFQKQKAMHVFGLLDSARIIKVLEYNVNWLTLISWGSQKNIDSETFAFTNGTTEQNRRRDSTWKTQIELAQSVGLKVCLKPHMWLTQPDNGKWRSDIFPSSEENWIQWKNKYREFILLYAALAQETNVELFCIGTEFSRLSVEKSDFWSALIRDVRKVYNGKLTYAANWHSEYEQITFWEELDYIGIQAYFPLVKNKFPSTAEITEGWNRYIPNIEAVSKKYNRKILFTEMGYKSTANSAIEPWQWIEHAPDTEYELSLETQSNCYQAFFDTIWNKDWLAGVHLWQLDSRNINKLQKNRKDFSPHGKPAAEIIAKGFESQQ